LHQAAGKTLTVDLFALSSNKKCQRFHSFHHTQGTEGADAFDRLSWAHSKCPCGQTHSEYVYVFPPMDLLLPTWLPLERDRAAGIAIVPMSPAAPRWTIMKGGLISKMQTFAGTSLTIPDGCAKITHDKLTKLEFGIVEFDFSKSLSPHKNSPTCTPLCPQATSARLPPVMPSNSAIDKTARQSLWRALSTPSVHALNRHWVQQDMDLERNVASQDW